MQIEKVINSNMTVVQVGSSLQDIGPLLRNPAIFQKGYSYPSHVYYRHSQRGRGIGSVFAGLYRYFRPLLMKGLKTVGKEIFSAGTDIMSNANDQPLNSLVKTRGQQVYKDLKRKADQKMKSIIQSGEGNKGIKRMKMKNLNHSLVGIRPQPPPPALNKRKKAVSNTNKIKKSNNRKIKKRVIKKKKKKSTTQSFDVFKLSK